MWRGDVAATVNANIGVSHVVAHDHNNVRSAFLCRSRACGRDTEKQNRQQAVEAATEPQFR
jgi:hypothetical protein